MTTTSTPPPSELSQHIDKAAQQCVKCGLCLPYCPTYVLAQDENESARGRIALMQGAVRGQVPITERLTYHLDTCLGCRGCEAVCPANVQYEDLLTSTRAWLVDTGVQRPGLRERALIYLLERPRLRTLFKHLVKAIPKSLGFMSPLNHVATRFVTAKTSNTKKILLLQPCASTIFDTQTIQDAQKLLTHLGFTVELASPSYCCGALALHAGELSNAKKCAQLQVSQWQTLKPDYILSLASGCHATLQDYAKSPLNIAVPDISLQTIENFLSTLLQQNEYTFSAMPKKIAIHIPCTLRNAVRTPTIAAQLLTKIPELTCIPLPKSVQCCGAAGTNFLRHPDIASALVAPIIEFMREQKPDAWVTSNIGCALYVQQALKKEGIHIPVLHPISVLSQTLLPI